MSYRELRDFTEHLRALSYPRAVSIESFRAPNFPLIADLLSFLLKRYDPTIVYNESISTQSQRVSFIQSLTSLSLSQCNIKLSMKSLYRADGFAVRELLKLSSLLYKAVTQNNWEKQNQDSNISQIIHNNNDNEKETNSSESLSVSTVEEFRDAKQLSNELIDLGEKLSLSLLKDNEIRSHRELALTFVDSISGESNQILSNGQSSIERIIRKQLELMSDNLTELTGLISTLKVDNTKMSEKLSKKDAEFDRMEKRFQSLKKIRPAFQEELENQEKEIKTIYNEYIHSIRNLNFLEFELNSMREEEKEEKQENDKKMQKMQQKLKMEEMKILRGGNNQNDDDTDDSDNEDEDDDNNEEEDEEENDDDDDDENGGSEGEESKSLTTKARRGQRESDEEDEEDDENVDDDDEEEGSQLFDDGSDGDGDGNFNHQEESKYDQRNNKAKTSSSSIQSKVSINNVNNHHDINNSAARNNRAALQDSDSDDGGLNDSEDDEQLF